jgi:anti-anti-sigma factor
MPRSEFGSAAVECRAQDVARDVVRVWITGSVADEDAAGIDRLLCDVERRASVILLDLRAAPLTAALRALIEAADTRTRARRRRLVILEQPVPGAHSELALLGLTARIMSLEDLSERDRGASPASPIARFERGRRVVVEVLAALDGAVTPELDAELAMHAARGRSIVLDLRAVRFMDSAGVRVLVDARDRAQERSLGFAVLPSDAVTRTLEAANLRHLLAWQPASPPLRSY